MYVWDGSCTEKQLAQAVSNWYFVQAIGIHIQISARIGYRYFISRRHECTNKSVRNLDETFTSYHYKYCVLGGSNFKTFYSIMLLMVSKLKTEKTGKYLGVLFSDNFRFDQHIDAIVKKQTNKSTTRYNFTRLSRKGHSEHYSVVYNLS